jgi:putative two-component system protein, hydrogenase maturation factor HypX/HoxX
MVAESPYTSRKYGMDILFLTSAHNSLSQRLLTELTDRDHRVAVALATSEEAMLTAVAEHAPISSLRQC